MHRVWRAAALLLAGVLAGLPAAGAEPLRATHTLEIRGHELPVAMEIWLTAESQTRIGFKVAGNLAPLQRRLPEMLSTVIEDTCQRRIGLEISDVRAEGDDVRVLGRVQLIRYACDRTGNRETRRRLIGNITAVDALLVGKVTAQCVEVELQSLTIDPAGAIGTVMNLTRLSQRVAGRVRGQINAWLNDRETCIDLPEALQRLDARIDSGGFRDFGGGTMGVVVTGDLTVTARNVIAFLELMDQKGALDD